jgi:putative MATE family efflux protein
MNLMQAHISDKGFYKSLALLTIPIALQNLIGLGMNLMDTVMLGSLGEKQISASSLANQPYFIFTLFMFGLCSGACVLTAQYWGKSDTETISKIMALAIKASVLCSIVFSAVVLIFPEFVISLYTSDKDVIRLGAQFLRIIGFSYLISAVSTTYLYVLRSVENVRLPLLINFTSFVVNTILNWILIYGKFGAPAMGIKGSATATLCARILELAMALTYAFAFDKTLKIRLRYILKTDMHLLRDFLRYSAPVVANETMWGIGISMQSVVIGHMGSQEVAANSIAGVVQRLGMVVIFGMANAAAVIVGKQIGAGNQQKAKKYARKMLVLSVIMGIVSAAFVLLIKDFMVGFYNVDETTKNYARQIIEVYAGIIMFQAFNTVNIVGILRGGGDTRFAMIADITTLWVFALPFGALAGLYFKWPLPLVFFLLTSDEAVKFLIGIWRFRTGNWLRNVTR